MNSNQRILEDAVIQHTRAIRKTLPIKVKLHYANGILHSLAYEPEFLLKSTYDSLAFAKLILSTYSRDISCMFFQEFEALVKSFQENEDIQEMRSGVYDRKL